MVKKIEDIQARQDEVMQMSQAQKRRETFKRMAFGEPDPTKIYIEFHILQCQRAIDVVLNSMLAHDQDISLRGIDHELSQLDGPRADIIFLLSAIDPDLYYIMDRGDDDWTLTPIHGLIASEQGYRLDLITREQHFMDRLKLKILSNPSDVLNAITTVSDINYESELQNRRNFHNEIQYDWSYYKERKPFSISKGTVHSYLILTKLIPLTFARYSCDLFDSIRATSIEITRDSCKFGDDDIEKMCKRVSDSIAHIRRKARGQLGKKAIRLPGTKEFGPKGKRRQPKERLKDLLNRKKRLMEAVNQLSRAKRDAQTNKQNERSDTYASLEASEIDDRELLSKAGITN